MAKQNDTMPCTRIACKGKMTYHEKLNVDPQSKPPVRPSGLVGGRPDANYSGWLCDANSDHVDWDTP